ncbi:MAG: hypothetical protein ACOX5T_09810 [Candidatus Cryptobacteroides sp.]|nr:hypothetical protein [Bacteroidota bacterium]
MNRREVLKVMGASFAATVMAGVKRLVRPCMRDGPEGAYRSGGSLRFSAARLKQSIRTLRGPDAYS